MSESSARIRWGVIEDARTRQHRWRRRGLVAAVVAIALGVPSLALFSGGETRFAVPPPGKATGSLRALAVSDYHFWVTPDLAAGNATLDIRVTGPGAQWGMTGCCDGRLGQGPIIGIAGGDSVPAPVSFEQVPDDVLLVSPNVAAVRVGDLGTAGAVRARGLQPGEKVVAFRVPQHAAKPHRIRVRLPGPAHHGRAILVAIPPRERTVPLTALDRSGVPLPAVTAAPTASEGSTIHGGACAINAALPGLTHQAPRAVTTIEPVAPSARGVFLSCLNEILFYRGAGPRAANLQVAILVNAHRPDERAAPLWGSIPVPGHPGIVELKPPPSSASTSTPALRCSPAASRTHGSSSPDDRDSRPSRVPRSGSGCSRACA